MARDLLGSTPEMLATVEIIENIWCILWWWAEDCTSPASGPVEKSVKLPSSGENLAPQQVTTNHVESRSQAIKLA